MGVRLGFGEDAYILSACNTERLMHRYVVYILSTYSKVDIDSSRCGPSEKVKPFHLPRETMFSQIHISKLCIEDDRSAHTR